MRLIVVSGRSSSGKSTALSVLEDAGFNCIDNLPAILLRPLVEETLYSSHSNETGLAICIDARNNSLNKFTELFDEIDRGVGGSTADAIGRRLLDLSSFGQIITVTHSPQVAALASSHFQVLKELGNNGEVSISIKELKKSDRVEELARMISGKVITNEAKAAADSLISNGYSKETFN